MNETNELNSSIQRVTLCVSSNDENTARRERARLPNAMASATTIKIAAAANVTRMPVATVSARAVVMSVAAAASAETPDLKQIVRTFTLRTSEGFVENFGPELIARAGREAPGVRLCFVQKPNKESTSLHDGSVELETGVVGNTMGPEVRAQALFRDRFIGVVRMGHALSKGKVTLARYAKAGHISVSRRGAEQGPIDEALKPFGLKREIVTIVGGFSTALALARASDLVASVPELHTGRLRDGMHSFPLPISTPEITISLLWHPRLDADPAHRWLRGLVLNTCRGEPLKV